MYLLSLYIAENAIEITNIVGKCAHIPYIGAIDVVDYIMFISFKTTIFAAYFGSEMFPEYTAMWRMGGNRITFRLEIKFQGWVTIGFSKNKIVV